MEFIMEQIVTIIALIIGWGLNEISHFFHSTKEHKQAIAHALSILLEVRFQIIYIENVIQILKEKGMPDEVIPKMKQFAKSMNPVNGLIDEYEAAL
jgi:hypothetical protein